MKTRFLALLVAALLLLTGCSAMLNRTYLSVTPHAGHPSTEEDPSILKVESYQELVGAILYLASAGTEHGVLHLSNYKGDVEADLTAACLEVVQEDPLGAYAIDFMKHDYTRIISYYEANIYITYRRTQAQVKRIVSVTGSSAIKSELRQALGQFAPEAVLQVSYFTGDEAYIEDLVRQAYYDTPLSALGMPELTISLYPDAGYQRIVEILLAYPESNDRLGKKQRALATAADTMCAGLENLRGEARARAVFSTLRSHVTYIPWQDGAPTASTAYDALVAGRGDSEGMALAFQLFAQLANLDAVVVCGTRDDVPHYWNIICLDNGEYRHVDATRGDGYALTDEALAAAGYGWTQNNYPACGAASVT